MKGGALQDRIPGDINEADPGILGPGNEGPVPRVGQELDGEDVAGMVSGQLHQLPPRLTAPQDHSLPQTVISSNRYSNFVVLI